MQIFKSLFCIQGFDNRNRFFIINNAIYLVFIFLSNIVSTLVATALVLLCLIIMSSTLKRRLDDSGLNKKWLFIPSALFLIASSITLLVEHHSSYWLLFIPWLISNALLTYPSALKKHYILGYSGPVDLSEYNKMKSKQNIRIEPTMNGIQQSAAFTLDVENHEQVLANPAFSIKNEDSSDIGERIRLALLTNKNVLIGISAVIILIIISVFISALFSSSSTKTSPIEVIEKQPIVKTERLQPLTMPDNFILTLSPDNGLFINWQAEFTEKTTLWEQKTAKGDQSCLAITFNNNSFYRTLDVTVENNELYFASFSPLDTQAILKSLAKGSSFSICDYSFSLKGSQAAIGRNERYAELML